MSGSDDSRYRFGVFDFDAKTLELRKHGRTLRVRPQSLRLLALLVTRAGELVARDDIQLALWGRDTHVDFEQGVNHCIKELRNALGDAVESPRFIETVPRRGYRFITPIERASVPAQQAQLAPVQVPPTATVTARRRLLVLGTGAVTLAVVLGTIVWRTPATTGSWDGAAISTPGPTSGDREPVRRPTTNQQAYDAYLKGMFYVRRSGAENADRAISFLERAVQIDPFFALAYAELGSRYMARFFYVNADPALEQKAIVAVDRALAIDPNLAEGYLARAKLVWTLPNRFPHERAIRDLQRAVALKPSLGAAHAELGKIYLHVGLLEESIAANIRAVQIDPADGAFFRRVLAHLYLRQCETALQLLDQLGARNARRRAEVLRCLGRDDDALRELSSSDPFPSLRAALLARKGQSAAARRELATAQTSVTNAEELSHAHHAQYYRGVAHALLGDRRQAVSWLKKASTEGLPCYPLFERDPDLNSLQKDPEFIELLLELKAQADRLRHTAGQSSPQY